jgi:metal-dependent amidase/aminoacylase/carboxypeptidase family protein
LKPRSKIILGTIQGGFKHGQIAHDARLGFEIRSDADEMVKTIYADLEDIVAGIRHEYEVGLAIETVSNLRAARLKYTHPLVKSTVALMERLGSSRSANRANRSFPFSWPAAYRPSPWASPMAKSTSRPDATMHRPDVHRYRPNHRHRAGHRQWGVRWMISWIRTNTFHHRISAT